MANENNAVGFTGCPDHLEVWRKQAAREAASTNLATLLTELIKAFGDIDFDQPDTAQYFCGMRDAYAILAGLDRTAVERLVIEGLDQQIAEEVARRPSAQVPS